MAATRKKRTLKSKDRLIRRKKALENHLQKVCCTGVLDVHFLFWAVCLLVQTILAEAFKEAIAADKAMERPRSSQVCRVAVVSSESHRHASYLSHRDRFLLPTFVCTHQFPSLKSHYSRHFALNQLLSGRSSARTGARVAQHMRSQIAFGDFPSHDAGTPSPARSGWVDTSEHDR